MAIQDEIPKSRLTLKYRTEISGQPEDVNLPLRLMVLGDFSGGTSKDRKEDLENRRLRAMDGKNTDAVMKDMKISLDLLVENKVDPDKEGEVRVKLPIESMKSFSPDQIVKNVPKLKSLMMLKKLLNETLSNVANKKEFRNLLTDLYGNPEAFNKVMEELKGYEGFRLAKEEKK